jgi:hypothetical protein
MNGPKSVLSLKPQQKRACCGVIDAAVFFLTFDPVDSDTFSVQTNSSDKILFSSAHPGRILVLFTTFYGALAPDKVK